MKDYFSDAALKQYDQQLETPAFDSAKVADSSLPENTSAALPFPTYRPSQENRSVFPSYGQAAIPANQPAAVNEDEEVGVVEGLWDAGAAGFDSGTVMMQAAAYLAGADSASIANTIAEHNQNKNTPAYYKNFMQELSKIGNQESGWDQGWDTFTHVLQNPRSLAHLSVETLTQMYPQMITAGAGTLAGSWVPVIGNTVGAATGYVFGNIAFESGAKVLEIVDEILAEQGGSNTNPADVRAVLESEGFKGRATKEGLTKGAVISAIDLATMGIGGKILTKTERALDKGLNDVMVKFKFDPTDPKARELAWQDPKFRAEAAPVVEKFVTAKASGNKGAVATAFALETVGEGVGEYLGEEAATGEGNVSEAVLESMASGGVSAIQLTAAQGLKKAKLKIKDAPLDLTEDIKKQQKAEQDQKKAEQDQKKEAKKAFDLADRQRQRAINHRLDPLTENQPLDARAGGQIEGQEPTQNFIYHNVVIENGQMTAGSLVDVLEFTPDGERAWAHFVDQVDENNQPIIEMVELKDLQPFEQPVNPRMAQDFEANAYDAETLEGSQVKRKKPTDKVNIGDERATFRSNEGVWAEFEEADSFLDSQEDDSVGSPSPRQGETYSPDSDRIGTTTPEERQAMKSEEERQSQMDAIGDVVLGRNQEQVEESDPELERKPVPSIYHELDTKELRGYAKGFGVSAQRMKRTEILGALDSMSTYPAESKESTTIKLKKKVVAKREQLKEQRAEEREQAKIQGITERNKKKSQVQKTKAEKKATLSKTASTKVAKKIAELKASRIDAAKKIGTGASYLTTNSERQRLTTKIGKMNVKTRKELLKGTGLIQAGTKEEQIERLISAKEGTVVIAGYKNLEEFEDAIKQGKIHKEDARRWAEAVKHPNENVGLEQTSTNAYSLYNYAKRKAGLKIPERSEESQAKYDAKNSKIQKESIANKEQKAAKKKEMSAFLEKHREEVDSFWVDSDVEGKEKLLTEIGLTPKQAKLHAKRKSVDKLPSSSIQKLVPWMLDNWLDFKKNNASKTDKSLELSSMEQGLLAMLKHERRASGKGINKTEVEKGVAVAKKALKGVDGIKVSVYQTQDEVFPERAYPVSGQYDPVKDELILVADNISDTQDLVKTLRHELIAHKGLRHLLREEDLRAITNRIKNAAKVNPKIKKLWKEIKATYSDAADHVIAEEVLAHMAESKVGDFMKFLDAILALLTKALRSVGLVDTPITMSEMRTLLAKSVANLRKEGGVDVRREVTPSFAKRGLDPSYAARIKRAKEQGFDTEIVYYHGTNADVRAFSNKFLGSATGATDAHLGFFFAPDPMVASEFVDLYEMYERNWENGVSRLTKFFQRLFGIKPRFDGGNVVPVFLRVENPYTVNFNGREYNEKQFTAIIKSAKEQGHDSVVINNVLERTLVDARHTSVKVVFDSNNIRSVNAMFDPAGQQSADLLFRRKNWAKHEPESTSTGKIHGAPQWVNDRSDLIKLRKMLRKYMDEGLDARFWYEDSAKSVMEMVNNDVIEAEKFLQLVAIYSPRATVQVNTGMAIKAYNQYLNDVSESNFEVVGTKERDNKAKDLLYSDTSFNGRKTNSFYINLMHHIIDTNPDALNQLQLDDGTMSAIHSVDSVDLAKVTNDVWMARAFNYDSDAFPDDKGKGAYTFAENEVKRLTAEYNAKHNTDWLPHQVQAAIWSSIKTRFETEAVAKVTKAEKKKRNLDTDSSAYRDVWRKHALALTSDEVTALAKENYAHYGSYIYQMTEVVTWEAVPSEQLGEAIFDADNATKKAYTAKAREIVMQDGVDMLASMLGVPIAQISSGTGSYAGHITPNNLSHLLPSKLPEGKGFNTELVGLYARAIQFIFKQEAVPWFRADKLPLSSIKARDEQMFRVLKGTRTAAKFKTQTEAEAYLLEKGEGYSIKGGPLQRGIAIRFDQALTEESRRKMLDHLTSYVGEDANFTQTAPNELTLINFRDDNGIPWNMTDEVFADKIQRMSDAIGNDMNINELGQLWAEGDYGYVHNWEEDPTGESGLERAFSGRSDLLAWIRDRRADNEALLQEFNEKARAERSDPVQRGEGLSRLKKGKPSSAKSIPRKRVLDDVRRFQESTGATVNILVLDHPSEIGLDDEHAMGAFSKEHDTVLIFADNITSEDDVRRTIAHEVVGHHGLRHLLGSRYEALMSQVMDSKDKRIAQTRARVRKDGYAEHEVADETLAYLAEEEIKHPILIKLYSMVRKAMRFLGIKTRLTHKDVQALILESRKSLKDVAAKHKTLRDLQNNPEQFALKRKPKKEPTDRVSKQFEKWGALGSLPRMKKYLEIRYRAKGKIGAVDEVARGIRKAFGQSKHPDQIYKFLTSRDVSADTIDSPTARAEAIKVKNMIHEIGKTMVEKKIISQEAFDTHDGEYLPFIYLKHLLDDKSFMALGKGKKPSQMGYTEHRGDIPAEIRELVLGQVFDPAYLSVKAITEPTRDMALLDWLDEVTLDENGELNTDWVMENSVIEWEGTFVTPYWLKEQGLRMIRQADFMPNKTSADKTRKLAIKMVSAADDALEAQGYDPDVVPDGWKEVPKGKRYGRMSGLRVRTEIYDDIIGSAQIFTDQESVAEKVLGQGGMVTRYTQIWKFLKVAANPPAQIRNIVSNLVLLNLSGIPIYKLPIYVGKAIKQIHAKKGVGYDVAMKYGVTESTYTAHEMTRFQEDLIAIERQKDGHPLIVGFHIAKSMAKHFSNKAGDIYQFMEQLGKTTKIIYEMDVNGATEVDAMLEAQKWLFDYSLVRPSVRYLRNAPVGVPFLTFYTKVLPRIWETIRHNPQRFIPYIALHFGLQAWAMAELDLDDDEYDKLKQDLPNWVRSKVHAYPLPWKDDNGKVQLMDLGYFFPWEMWLGIGSKLSKGEVGEALKTTGIAGGPLPNLLSAMQQGRDPFTGREIYNKGDPSAYQIASILLYMWDLNMPTMITRIGAAGKVMESLDIYDIAGVPISDPKLPHHMKLTTGQASLRSLGLNIYAYDPSISRAQNIKKMKRDIEDTQDRMKQLLRDTSLSAGARQEMISTYQAEIRKRIKKLQEYVAISGS